MKKFDFKDDLNFICFQSNLDFSRFNNKTILITGSTGLIGFTLTSSFLHYGTYSNNAPKIIALVRNIEKAQKLFSSFPPKNISFIQADIKDVPPIDQKIDYVIHCASETSSKSFVTDPLHVIQTSLIGTYNMLQLSKEKKVKSFIYLSTMEVYGSPQNDQKIIETASSNLDTMNVRSSYPESKRMCETLCSSFYSQYGVPCKVIRLTQTIGPGVSYHDSRVFAEFIRCAFESKDIVLHTKGETKRSYLYTADAVTAILTVLLDGNPSEAYNAANEDTFCSIYEMANLVSKVCTNGKIKVLISLDDVNSFGYAPQLIMNLDTKKLQNLGWRPTFSLREMYERLFLSFKDI